MTFPSCPDDDTEDRGGRDLEPRFAALADPYRPRFLQLTTLGLVARALDDRAPGGGW